MNLLKSKVIRFAMENKASLFFFCFFMLLIISSFFVIPYEDSYYYWDWSRHLSLSYFDGPPLIAYSIRYFTLLFGNTIYAINIFGVLSIYLTLFFIYKTTELIFNKQAALYASLLWLLSPLVARFLIIWVTYDNLLNLFWAITIYFLARYTLYKKTIDLYLIGCSLGLLLLSKYTGVILLLALFFFILFSSQYRTLLKNKHFYGSIFIAVLIISPVLIWNFQNNWVSFTYQLSIHTANTWSWKSVLSYVGIAFGNYNILLLLPLYVMFKSYHSLKQNDFIILLNFISFTFLLFFFYQSFNHKISQHWLVPFCISSAILCGYYFINYNFHKIFLFTIIIYFLISMYYIVAYSVFQKYIDDNIATYSLIKNAGRQYWHQNKIILASNWEMASKLAFWLPGKPSIYTLPCGGENQYAYWSQPIMQMIKDKQINEVLFISLEDNVSCIKKYFTQCNALPTFSYEYDGAHLKKENKSGSLQLYVYQCLT